MFPQGDGGLALDYAAWLPGLRGAPFRGDEKAALKHLASDAAIDYVRLDRRVEFHVNNIAVLQRDPEDPDRLFHDITLPRGCDVAEGIQSIDPRVSVSVTINRTVNPGPNASVIVVAAQYNEVYVRLSFSLADIKSERVKTVGYSYKALYFNHDHRVLLARSNLDSDDVQYRCGVASPAPAK